MPKYIVSMYEDGTRQPYENYIRYLS
jgi:hypothetical protein